MTMNDCDREQLMFIIKSYSLNNDVDFK